MKREELTIIEFDRSHVDDAAKIALANYCEERSIVTALPQIDKVPDLEAFADNGLGVAICGNGGMLGFLCCLEPWENAFNSAATGTFSPIHAHGAVRENRALLYRRLYEAAAAKWVKGGIGSHAIALYAHDSEAIGALFSYGFGLRCIDAVRPLRGLDCGPCEDGISFGELAKRDIARIRGMRKMLSEHLAQSPCFMYSPPEVFEKWMSRAEARDSRVFVASRGETPVAFIEATDEGENFASDAGDMKNICGAFCLPEFRGRLIVQALLDYVIAVFRGEGYRRLGVDFESFNSTASGFWLKYFVPYSNSVVRVINIK